MSTSLAARCFDRNQAEFHLYTTLEEILGEDSVVDCWVDDYDQSVEIICGKEFAAITREQADKILALGFYQIYESHSGDQLSIHWTKDSTGSCSPRERNESHSKLLKARQEIAELNARLAENTEVTDSLRDEIQRGNDEWRELCNRQGAELQASQRREAALRDALSQASRRFSKDEMDKICKDLSDSPAQPAQFVRLETARGLANMVQSLQWIEKFCPHCYSSEMDGHEADCGIGKALAAFEAEVGQ